MRIVLAHGVLGFRRILDVEYFNGVAARLQTRFRDRNLRVTASTVPPTGSIKDRAAKLAPQIVAAFNEKKEKVHIFAHSMGGLDARHAIFENIAGVADCVASLVMIGTPHLGSPVADRIHDNVPLPDDVDLLIDRDALKDLTTAAAKKFNDETPDDTATKHGIRYCYVAGDVSLPESQESGVFASLARYGNLTGRHDGVVPLESATRGDIKNLLVPPWAVDHAGEVGWNLDKPRPARLFFGLLPNFLADTLHFERYEKLVSLL